MSSRELKVQSKYVHEVRPVYTKTDVLIKSIKAQSSSDVVRYLRQEVYDQDLIGYREEFNVLFINKGNEIIQLYRHTTGSISGVQVDIRMILALALSCGAYAMILTHNHPSGRTYLSESDKKITKQFADAAKLHDIKILDHIIVSQESYYSFADEGGL